MVLKVYGASHSTCTRRVLTVLAEKNVNYELISINLAKSEQSSLEFRKKQPFGKVPVLDDDGFLVYESRAICKYIARKFAGQGTRGLVPEEGDLKAYGAFEQVSKFAGRADGSNMEWDRK
jgi:glutathione S-transferase